MKHRPLSKQRSPWVEVGPDALRLGRLWLRNVSDGALRAIVAREPEGWHLSISFVNHRGEPTRYPRWDEIVHARAELLPPDIGFVMHLPPADEYVALHDTTFHLHQHPPASGSTTADEVVTGRSTPNPTGGEAP